MHEIDLPSMVVKKWITHQLDVLNLRQKIEQRIAWRWNQKLVARIAERSKDIGIRFARAASKKNIFSRNFLFAIGIIPGDRLARGFQPPRIRLVGKRLWIAQRVQDRGAVVFETAFRGI